jgi:hypothetical protein
MKLEGVYLNEMYQYNKECLTFEEYLYGVFNQIKDILNNLEPSQRKEICLSNILAMIDGEV